MARGACPQGLLVLPDAKDSAHDAEAGEETGGRGILDSCCGDAGMLMCAGAGAALCPLACCWPLVAALPWLPGSLHAGHGACGRHAEHEHLVAHDAIRTPCCRGAARSATARRAQAMICCASCTRWLRCPCLWPCACMEHGPAPVPQLSTQLQGCAVPCCMHTLLGARAGRGMHGPPCPPRLWLSSPVRARLPAWHSAAEISHGRSMENHASGAYIKGWAAAPAVLVQPACLQRQQGSWPMTGRQHGARSCTQAHRLPLLG